MELLCSDKLAFETIKEAVTAATVAEHQRGTKLKPYKCTKCELWHLTSRYKNEDDD